MDKKYFNSNDARNLINTFGFSIFPIHGIQENGICTCNKTDCHSKGKHPATPDGFKSATNNIDKMLKLWAGRQGLNVGVATGKVSGIFVIDIDSPQAEIELFKRFDIPATYTMQTGRGKHLYFKYDENNPVKNGAKVIEGVDIRGDGGYVAGMGSIHANGKVYEPLNPFEDIVDCPPELLEFCINNKETSTALVPVKSSLFSITSDGWTIDQVREHLSCISPDIPRQEWVGVGMALHAEDAPVSLFEEWSSRGARYVAGEPTKIWNGFTKGKGTTYGTVVHLAKQGGWQYEKAVARNERAVETVDPDTGEVVEVASSVRQLPLIYASDMEASLEVNDFVRGILRENECSVVYGESNCGKTFFTLDLALHVALGIPWRGLEVEQGGVIYVALEGGHGVTNRITAFKKHHNIQGEIPLAVIPTNIDFLDIQGDIQSFLNAIEEAKDRIGDVKLSIIDTLARAMGGGDENSGQDMGALVKSGDLIRERTNSAIQFIHHCGKDVARGMRGHSSLLAAIDTEIEISREEGENGVITYTKQREMVKADPMGFSLEQVILGTDRRGNDVSSCVINIEEYEIQVKKTNLTAIQQFVYDAIVSAVDERGFTKNISKDMPPQRVATYDDMREILEERGYKEVLETENKTTAQQIKSATQSARIALKRHGKINFNGKHVWLLYGN